MSDECLLFIGNTLLDGYYKKALFFLYFKATDCCYSFYRRPFLVAKNITFQVSSNELEITE